MRGARGGTLFDLLMAETNPEYVRIEMDVYWVVHPGQDNVALGQGIIDWPHVLRAAKQAGVKWYFIEDESPASVEQIPQSLGYLETLKF